MISPERLADIEEYNMVGALEAPLRENLADGFRLAVLTEHAELVRIIESAKMKDPVTGQWTTL